MSDREAVRREVAQMLLALARRRQTLAAIDFASMNLWRCTAHDRAAQELVQLAAEVRDGR